MDFYHKWSVARNDVSYMIQYLNKSDESRDVFRNGTECDVKFACDFLRNIQMETFLKTLHFIPTERLPNTDEIPQCGTIEKALCEVPQALAFAPDGLICSELGLRIGAENHGDAPRKSGEGNGKLADALDIVIRMKLPLESGSGMKFGYKLSALGHYLLRYETLSEKKDIIARLLIREYLMQKLFSDAIDGYADYNQAVSALNSVITRMRRRQNVRRIVDIIDSELNDCQHYYQYINWELEDKNNEPSKCCN